MGETADRISVSRDALRADLSEMELRLRIYFDEQLKHKADSGEFARVALKLDQLDRGEFTDVHRRALTDLIREQTTARADSAWTARSRVMAVLSAGTMLAAFVLSIILAFHGVVL